MTDTPQGGPIKGVVATTTASDVPDVKRDPMTGINKDMPGSLKEASGHPPGFRWGDEHHR